MDLSRLPPPPGEYPVLCFFLLLLFTLVLPKTTKQAPHQTGPLCLQTSCPQSLPCQQPNLRLLPQHPPDQVGRLLDPLRWADWARASLPLTLNLLPTSDPEVPQAPRSLLEALEQRMERYHVAAAQAKAKGDQRKARMHERIVKVCRGPGECS